MLNEAISINFILAKCPALLQAFRMTLGGGLFKLFSQNLVIQLVKKKTH